MDRREALKKLSAGSAIAIGTPLVLSGVAVAATPSPTCLVADDTISVSPDPPTIVGTPGSGGYFVVQLSLPADTTVSVSQSEVVSYQLDGSELTVYPHDWGGSVYLYFDHPLGWCVDEGSITRWQGFLDFRIAGTTFSSWNFRTDRTR